MIAKEVRMSFCGAVTSCAKRKYVVQRINIALIKIAPRWIAALGAFKLSSRKDDAILNSIKDIFVRLPNKTLLLCAEFFHAGATSASFASTCQSVFGSAVAMKLFMGLYLPTLAALFLVWSSGSAWKPSLCLFTVWAAEIHLLLESFAAVLAPAFKSIFGRVIAVKLVARFCFLTLAALLFHAIWLGALIAFLDLAFAVAQVILARRFFVARLAPTCQSVFGSTVAIKLAIILCFSTLATYFTVGDGGRIFTVTRSSFLPSLASLTRVTCFALAFQAVFVRTASVKLIAALCLLTFSTLLHSVYCITSAPKVQVLCLS